MTSSSNHALLRKRALLQRRCVKTALYWDSIANMTEWQSCKTVAALTNQGTLAWLILLALGCQESSATPPPLSPCIDRAGTRECQAAKYQGPPICMETTLYLGLALIIIILVIVVVCMA